jgi:hypothetical protein
MTELLYIASPSFSGSTLLTLLLAAHPRVATVGELKGTSMGDVESYRCSCGELIRACAFWRALTAALSARGVAFDVGQFGTHFRAAPAGALADRLLAARLRGRIAEWARGAGLALLPRARRELRRVRARNRAVMEAVCALRGADVFLDASKDPVRLRHLIDGDGVPARVIHLVRDGRGVAASYMRVYGWPMEPAALEWRRTNEECERLRDLVRPEAWLRLHYEDLCRDPDRAVAAALGLVAATPAGPVAGPDGRAQHVLGNAMRLTDGAKVALKETWRETLAAADLAVFERVAGAMNRRLGYA